MMTKRAAIYIRVSTERQFDKASPIEQEKDCRAYCQERGYTVIDVYREIEKYRVGGRMIEPSGTRADRPQLRRMLAEAEAGAFDLIIAWREDRLYRGLRPMLEVIDAIERAKITIELVKETFDARMAPIKSAIARMEIDAIKERSAMGSAARLESGKVQRGRLPYGYTKDENGRAAIFEPEAVWVRRVFDWYAEGVGLREIRRRMIRGGAEQRQANREKGQRLKVDWAIPIIQHWISSPLYWTGKQPTRAAGRTFETPYPPLVSPELAQLIAERKARHKQHPAYHQVHPFLVNGLAYCAHCGVKLQAKSRWKRDNRRGPDSPKFLELSYACKYYDIGYQDLDKQAECCRTISARALDAKVWEKVERVLNDDVYFARIVAEALADIEAGKENAEAENDRLQKALDDLAIERQKIIGWGLKDILTEQDMALRLGGMELEKAEIDRELARLSVLLDNRAERLVDFANGKRAELRAGLAFLAQEPDTEEARAAQYARRREAIEVIVERVEVTADKEPIVKLAFGPSGDCGKECAGVGVSDYNLTCGTCGRRQCAAPRRNFDGASRRFIFG